MSMGRIILAAATCIATAGVVSSCAAGRNTPPNQNGGGGSGGDSTSSSGGMGGFDFDGGSTGGGPLCPPCSADGTQVIDCDGNVIQTCSADQLCGAGACVAPCNAAEANRSSIGCDYYAVTMDTTGGGFGGCFVAFIANTWNGPVHINATWGGTAIDLTQHARIPKGNGPTITYEPYDVAAGLPAGEVAILFLANDPVQHGTWIAPAACPVPAAVGLDAHVHYGLNISTGRSKGFHITTDRPTVAYQMLPYNAAYAATTGATLLLPTSAWDTNYVAVEASRYADWMGLPIPPSLAVIAKQDATKVTILPGVDIKQGIDVAEVKANQVGTYTLNAGEFIEFIQSDELTGSPVQSDKPIGLFAGHLGMRIPFDVDWSEHAEQQIPPVRAMGSEYAVASYRDRVPGIAENRLHRLVGAVDGTILAFDPPIPGAATMLQKGSFTEFNTDTPFVVKSQDKDHPFMAFTYMSGSGNIANAGGPAGYGDAEFVRIVPGLQYLRRYVFFTDPTYPETNLVVVRRKGTSGFESVELDCAGSIGPFSPIGNGADYEYARVDLSRHNFEAQGSCNNGRHEMTSKEPFGLWVWGWGSPETRPGESSPCDNTQPNNSCDVSYAYPAGENVVPINAVEVLPIPK